MLSINNQYDFFKNVNLDDDGNLIVTVADTSSALLDPYDTFGDLPLVGVEDVLYLVRDENVLYTYSIALNGYYPVNDPNIVNPDAPEEGGVFFADLATTATLNACTYNNGTAGVGATLTGNVNGQLSQSNQTAKIDNVTTSITLTPIILVKNQSNKTQNGIYQITQLGDVGNPFILTRIDGNDETSEIYPSSVVINQGTDNALRTYYQTTIDPIVGTNNIVYALSATTNATQPLLSVVTAITSNLDATYASGTAYATLPAYGATLTCNINTDINSYENTNGVTLASGDRVLVVGMTDPKFNGDYTLTRVGNATLPYILTRIGYSNGLLAPKNRGWVVSNSTSAVNGSMWYLTNTALINSTIGVSVNLVFNKVNGLYNILAAGGNHTDGLSFGSEDPNTALVTNVLDLGQSSIANYNWKIGDRDVTTCAIDYQSAVTLLNIYNNGEIDINTNYNTLSLKGVPIILEADNGMIINQIVLDPSNQRISISQNSATMLIDLNEGGTGNLNIENNILIGHINLVTDEGVVTISNIPNYLNDAAADADTSLPSGALYRTGGTRIVLQKP